MKSDYYFVYHQHGKNAPKRISSPINRSRRGSDHQAMIKLEKPKDEVETINIPDDVKESDLIFESYRRITGTSAQIQLVDWSFDDL